MGKAIVFWGVFCCFGALFAQEQEPESVALDANQFEEAFYDALKEKSMENHDKAIQKLQTCLQLQPQEAVVHFELAKNYFAIKDYTQAVIQFEKVLELKPDERWAWDGLYQIAKTNRNYQQAIVYLKKLIPYSTEYQEELVSTYMFAQKYEEALLLIEELNKTVGKRETRTRYKEQILKMPGFQNKAEITTNNNTDESNYIALIVKYANENNLAKSYEIAKELQTKIPNSPWGSVYVFKKYIDENQSIEAIQAMEKVMQNNSISELIKHRMLNEWLVFIKNKPELHQSLNKTIGYFASETTIPIAKEIGKFFQNQQQWNTAIYYYQIFEKNNPSEIENLLLWCQALRFSNQTDTLATKATEALEIYPSHPEFYYYVGWTQLQAKNYANAKENLIKGLDFVIDNVTLEKDFYKALVQVFDALNDPKNKEFYQKKL